MSVLSRYNLTIGNLPPGKNNSIYDIAGVRLGHVTLSDGPVQTGVSVIHTGPEHPFEHKCVAASHVFNGFGKSTGLVQLDELGQLETPIVLTNTLNVGTASQALVRHMLDLSPAIGETTGTVNPVVMECNDGAYLNDIRGMHVSESDVLTALAQRDESCEEGAIGAGTGMSCYELKGGLGSASRQIELSGQTYHVGCLALCNMGLLGDLLVDGRKVGQDILALRAQEAESQSELGSIILVLATDAPLSSRQLKRLCVRSGAGLARTGTQFGSGSGDIALAFSVANRIPHTPHASGLNNMQQIHEDRLDPFFRATIEASEEAILSCLFASQTTKGKHKRIRKSLADYWPLLS
ncbi:MAG: P1 family peptidase [Cohaesibacter sp.]|jgi:D-aminopeptidase|nr:P1 family peptidase [Cohaesibacter sp.]